MLVDFLILYDPADIGPARDLRAAVEDGGSSCLLRAANGAGPAAAPLHRAMGEAKAAVLLVSDRLGPAFWQHADVAIMRTLLAHGSEANRVLLVLATANARTALPHDLAGAPAQDAVAAGWTAVAAALAGGLRSSARPATLMVGHSMAIVDDIWDDLTTAAGGQPAAPTSHRQLFETSGDDLVVSDRGTELERITPDEYAKRLTAGQLEDVERIEKAMEVNLAAWKRVYPTRAVNAADGAVFDRVKDALGGDFDRLGYLLYRSGFWLDDHYEGVRAALRPKP